MNTRQTGTEAEETAVLWLESKGFNILSRNFRTRYAEIDIVACRDGMIHFIEVKKLPSHWESSEIALKIPPSKQHKIRTAAAAYLEDKGLSGYHGVCFDAAVVTDGCVTFYEGAF